LPLGVIDVTSFGRSNGTQAFTIRVPQHIENLSGETEARVLVEVLGVDIDFYSIENIHLINVPTDLNFQLVSETIDVRLRGRREDLDMVSDHNIRVVGDMRDFPPRIGFLDDVTVYLDGVDSEVGAVGNYRLSIRVLRD